MLCITHVIYRLKISANVQIFPEATVCAVEVLFEKQRFARVHKSGS